MAGVNLMIGPVFAPGAFGELPERVFRVDSLAVDVCSRNLRVTVAKPERCYERLERLWQPQALNPLDVFRRCVGWRRVGRDPPAICALRARAHALRSGG